MPCSPAWLSREGKDRTGGIALNGAGEETGSEGTSGPGRPTTGRIVAGPDQVTGGAVPPCGTAQNAPGWGARPPGPVPRPSTGERTSSHQPIEIVRSPPPFQVQSTDRFRARGPAPNF
ncbi:hypothetical protein GCM10009850_099730 [Nonomuraea monospora]|uniref:Uncharacterized protein n=1 Tax=Nonomuraea monospora TaxID=568818 RepID=A0ABP5PUR1_9ACTN